VARETYLRKHPDSRDSQQHHQAPPHDGDDRGVRHTNRLARGDVDKGGFDLGL
jgi:hypothetical protein